MLPVTTSSPYAPGMLDPRIRQLTSKADAVAAARTVTTPDEIGRFEEIARQTEAGREYLASGEWLSYRAVIASRGATPTSRPKTLAELARYLQYRADQVPETSDPAAAHRDAYRLAAFEVSALDIQLASTVTWPVMHSGMRFPEALRAAMSGAHIARAGWPAGSYVLVRTGYPAGIPINENTAAATGLPVGTPGVFLPYLERCDANEAAAVALGVAGEYVFQPWTPGQEDVFGGDWRAISGRAGLLT